ncbi:MAG: hypothetical protein AB1797_05410 [bacterium]
MGHVATSISSILDKRLPAMIILLLDVQVFSTCAIRLSGVETAKAVMILDVILSVTP